MVCWPWGWGSKGSVSKVDALVLDVEGVQPVRVMQHEAGSEPNGAPIGEMPVDPRRIARELLRAKKKLAIVVKVVDTHLETIGNQFPAEFPANPIFALGNKVKARTESEFHLEFHQLPAFIQACLAFHVVSKDQGELLTVGPARPTFRRTFGAGHDRPGIHHSLALAPGPPATHRQT